MKKKYDIINQITIEYKIQKFDKEIKISGGNFVDNNRIK